MAPRSGNAVGTASGRAAYDLAGRMTNRIDQRGWATAYTYDARGLLLSRETDWNADQTPEAIDAFSYDALGRMVTADRTTDDPVTDSFITRTYEATTPVANNFGDLLAETQQIGAENVQLTVSYTYDQAGNRSGVVYPSGVTLAYTFTVLDQVDTVTRDGNPLIDYDYFGGPANNGRLLGIVHRSSDADPDERASVAGEYGSVFVTHDLAGRMTNRTNQRGWVTAYTCEGRDVWSSPRQAQREDLHEHHQRDVR